MSLRILLLSEHSYLCGEIAEMISMVNGVGVFLSRPNLA